MTDFAKYLHLHRVRTVLQLITPEQEAGCPDWDRKTLQEYRDVPGAAFKRAHERQEGGGCLPMAIDDAGFERMTDEQMDRVDADVRFCLGRYYVLRLWRDCSV